MPTGAGRRADRHSAARLEDVARLGLDETAFLAATGAHPIVFVTAVVDLAGPRLLDVVPGRSGKAFTWLGLRLAGGPAGEGIPVASLDRSAATRRRCARRCPTRSGCLTRLFALRRGRPRPPVSHAALVAAMCNMMRLW